MKKQQKSIFLFLALILPVCIFLFLKFFGRNEFTVTPLFVDTYPPAKEGCPPVMALPYNVPDSVMRQLPFEADTLLVLFLGKWTDATANGLNRVTADYGQYPVGIRHPQGSAQTNTWKKCIFFLEDPLDLVLLDRSGTIRGQYAGSDREEVDRLLTELSIILKQY